jgi:hypothetical protein
MGTKFSNNLSVDFLLDPPVVESVNGCRKKEIYGNF